MSEETEDSVMTGLTTGEGVNFCSSSFLNSTVTLTLASQVSLTFVLAILLMLHDHQPVLLFLQHHISSSLSPPHHPLCGRDPYLQPTLQVVIAS